MTTDYRISTTVVCRAINRSSRETSCITVEKIRERGEKRRERTVNSAGPTVTTGGSRVIEVEHSQSHELQPLVTDRRNRNDTRYVHCLFLFPPWSSWLSCNSRPFTLALWKMLCGEMKFARAACVRNCKAVQANNRNHVCVNNKSSWGICKLSYQS